MSRAPLHLLAGGPAADTLHLTGLLRVALAATPVPAPRIAYIGAASDDHAAFFRRVAALLSAAGAGTVTLAPTASLRDADRARARSVLDAADLIFVSGGDVSLGMTRLRDAGLVDDLRARCAAGTPFVGLSAGSILLGTTWIEWRDPADDASATPFDCLACAPLICDAHSEADDWSELRTLIGMLPPGAVGYGIASDAMLRLDPDGAIVPLGGTVERIDR